jgi:hypothetical protein
MGTPFSEKQYKKAASSKITVTLLHKRIYNLCAVLTFVALLNSPRPECLHGLKV